MRNFTLPIPQPRPAESPMRKKEMMVKLGGHPLA
jgi:hypothetical protein